MAQPAPGRKPGVMERIAVISVALSIGVMLLSVAVVAGFKQEVARKMTGMAAHVAVTDVRGVEALDASPVRRTGYLDSLIRTTEGFVSMAPYAVKGGILRTDEAVEGVLLKGIDATYDRKFLAEWLVEGALPRIGDTVRTKDVLLSRRLAERLRIGVGDRIEMLFVEQDRLPHRDRFLVSGLYDSGMEEMDAAVVVTDLRNVQRLSGWSADEVSGYEVFVTDLDEAEPFARRLGRTLLYDETDGTENLAATSIVRRYPGVFDWLRAHDVNAAVVIAIMLAVAFFNMSAALLVLVLERTRTIGLLKALGMRNGPLRRVFLYRAAFVALRGLAWGNAAGLLLCGIQRWGHVVKLDADGYLLTEVPVALEWGWWLALNVGFVATIVALLLIPAHIVSGVKPDEAIRYE